MRRAPIDSTAIVSVGHDGDETLELEFKGGRVYQYSPVTVAAYREALAAERPGKALVALTRALPAKRIEAEPEPEQPVDYPGSVAGWERGMSSEDARDVADVRQAIEEDSFGERDEWGVR
jgi:hypothetical protein